MTLLIRLTLAWTVGLVIGYQFAPSWMLLSLLTIPAVSAAILYRQDNRIKQTALIITAILLGACRFDLAQPTIDADHIAFYNDQFVEVVGLVQRAPDVRDSYVNLRVRAERLTLDGQTRPIDGLILVRAPRYPTWAYGDRLRLQGRLETPPIFDDFSYKDYLARSDIHSLLSRPSLERLESGHGQPLWSLMLTFKQRASTVINHILNEPHAALLNGILLGLETNIPAELYDQFNQTGTSHIIVISGSNISFVAAILLLVGQHLFGRATAFPLTIGGILLYTLLVGADAAVSRAAVMGSVWVLAMWVGRPGLVLNGLFASALLLTALNPLMLWEVGFQLSFMATLGLIVLVPSLESAVIPRLQRWLKRDRLSLPTLIFSELLIITLAAQISTAPLLMYHFGQLSPISLLANLLIVPVQPLVMTLGALATGLGLLWLPMGQLGGWLVWLPLAWSVAVVEWTVSLPYAAIELGRVPLWLMGLLYTVIGMGIWAARPSNEMPFNLRDKVDWSWSLSQQTRWLIGGAVVVSLLMGVTVTSLPDGRLRVAFLDVGQGDAILLTLPRGQQILIDGGPSPTELAWRLGQEMPFWDRSLDLVLNTHPDFDHLSGLVPLLDRYSVEQIVQPDVAGRSQLYQTWQAALSEHRLTPVAGEAGMQLDLGDGVRATILSPGPASRGVDGVNNQSIVLHVRFGAVSFLLPGDIEASVEQRLVFDGLPTATVLKSPHHGSQTSSTDLFLDAVAPQLVVIQVGADNRFGHPHADVLQRYEERGLTILRTDCHGTVEFVTDGQRLWVETARTCGAE